MASVAEMKETGTKQKEVIGPLTANNGKNGVVTGWKYRMATWLIGFTVLRIALMRYKNPWRALRFLAKVINARRELKTTHPKIVTNNGKYYMNLHTPGWPSKAFNRCINHLFNLVSRESEISLYSIVFAITHKCGFQCEHCVEWDRLNSKDLLSPSDLVQVIKSFHGFGISQVHLSGGEPLNRIEDILFVLDAMPEGIDFWVYTNGYNLSAHNAMRLKRHGLTGVVISLDHHQPEKHDQFRGVAGSYKKAVQSAKNAIDSGLLLAFSCCATNNFVSMANLMSYVRICRDAGASFIQFLEPEPVGRYTQKNVALKRENQELIERVFYLLNFDASYAGYPIVSYPPMMKRLNGCPGGGLRYLYVDAGGLVQACPFCKEKSFPALTHDLEKNILSLRSKGCPMNELTAKSKLHLNFISPTLQNIIVTKEDCLILPFEK